MPKARLVEIKAGHLPILDEPVECARLVQEFLATAV
jgi:pimeloyl-ACP methyl ester carboxylesterase